MSESKNWGCGTRLGVAVFIIVGGYILKAVVDPDKPQVATPATSASPSMPPPLPLTEDQKLKIADFKAIVAASIAAKAIYSVDYNNGIMRISPQSWSVTKIDDKKGILQGFYVACRGNKPGEAVEILSDTNDEELGTYVGGYGANIEK